MLVHLLCEIAIEGKFGGRFILLHTGMQRHRFLPFRLSVMRMLEIHANALQLWGKGTVSSTSLQRRSLL